MSSDREAILITRIRNSGGNLLEYESKDDVIENHNKIHKWATGYDESPEWITESILEWTHELCLIESDKKDVDLECEQDKFSNRTHFML